MRWGGVDTLHGSDGFCECQQPAGLHQHQRDGHLGHRGGGRACVTVRWEPPPPPPPSSAPPWPTFAGVAIYGGQMYISTSNGSAIRLGAAGTGIPKTAGQVITNIPGIPAYRQPVCFLFFADLDPAAPGFGYALCGG